MNTGPKLKPVTVAAIAPKSEKLVRYDEVTLPRVYWTWPTVPDIHPDSAALDLLGDVLAGGDASRLHKKLVLEKRVSGDVSANSDTKESAGVFTLQSTAVSTADPEKSLAAIEAVFNAAIADLQANPPTEAELTRVLALHESSSYNQLTSPLMRAITLAVGFSQRNDPAEYQKEFCALLQGHDCRFEARGGAVFEAGEGCSLDRAAVRKSSQEPRTAGGTFGFQRT